MDERAPRFFIFPNYRYYIDMADERGRCKAKGVFARLAKRKKIQGTIMKKIFSNFVNHAVIKE